MKDILFERKINYYETDKMGIVHHSNYIRFFEEARCFWMEKNNLPYSLLEENEIQIPVIGVSAEYKYPAEFENIIEIKCTVTNFNGIKMVISYVITNKKTNVVLVTGETKHCFVDKNFKPINIKKLDSKIGEVLKTWVTK